MNISFVVPCYNESESILVFYRELIKTINSLPHDFEILFINDGSKDNTLELMKELSDKDNRVGYIDFSRNFGKEAAIMAGLEYCNGDAVFLMDADLQDPPRLIPQMMSEFETGCDCVYTRRITRQGEPVLRTLFAHMFYALINALSDIKIPEGTRDYRVMSRAYVDGLLACKEKNRFAKGLFQWVGFDLKCIDYENEDRAFGTSSWSFKRLLSYGMDGIISFSVVPLRITAISGLIVSFISFLFLAYILVKTLFFGNPTSGWASNISVTIFLSGIQLFSIGMLGEYIGRIFSEVKSRPVYLPKQVHNSCMALKAKAAD